MKLEKYLAIVAIFVLTACSETEDTAVGSAEPVEAAADKRPNILFIVADDLGFTDIGAFGGEISTPNLDELALQGVRLNNLHTAPSCQPMRVMLMSSNSVSAALEVRPLLPGDERDNVLSRDWVIIPTLLQDAGYATYMAGKWDLGRHEGYTPATRGFDRSFVQLNGSSSFFAETFLTGDALGFEDDGRRLELEDLPEDFYVTEHYTDKMLEYLRQNEEGKPWFAYMPYTAPHWPLQLPDSWLDRYAGQYEMGYDELRERRFTRAMEAGVLPNGSTLEGFEPFTEAWDALSPEEQRRYSRAQEIYAGMVEHLDMSIGRVVDYLDQSGQLENTVIVFTSDHGASSGEHGVYSGRGVYSGPTMLDGRDNSLENYGRIGSFIDHGRGFGEAASAPFMYQKGSMTEGGLRAASFVYYPAAIAGGAVSNELMTVLDFLPTFMDIAGTEHPGPGDYKGRAINDILGKSAWPYLTGQAEQIHTDRDTVGWKAGEAGALIRGNYKIINSLPPGQRGTTEWRLYDLNTDPGERNDIADEHPELVAELINEWETNWR